MNTEFEQGQTYLDEFRSVTIWGLLRVGIAAAWLWMLITTYGRPQYVPLVALLMLLASSGIIYLAAKIDSRLTTPSFLVILTAGITLFIVLGRNSEILYLYVAPVLCAGVLLRPGWGFTSAILISVLVIGLDYAIGGFGTDRNTLVSSIILITGFGAILAWSISQNLYRLLDWLYHSYRLSEQRTREAQIHRGQLRKTLKDLDLAYSRLRRSNEALAWAHWQAEEARQAKARFAANISHELRTPLNLIIGFADVIVTAPESYGQPLPAVYRGDLNAIYRNAKHLSDLIDDVLDLSQLEVDRVPLTRENANLGQVIEEAIRMIDGMVQTKGLTLAYSQPPEPQFLSFDVTRIRQVILNLLSNATRFTKIGGITVQLAVEKSEAVVTVSDTGSGLAPEKASHIFEEFYQIDDSVRREHGGTGLGLAISKRFIELHGGRIWVESKLGTGSTFGFSLPITSWSLTTPDIVDSHQPLSQLTGGAGSERILVVKHEDPALTLMLQRYFTDYQIKLAQSSRELLSALERWRPTAIVLDSEQRTEIESLLIDTGWEGVPLISCPLPARPRIAMQLQTNDYLLKPVTRQALGEALTKVGHSFRKVLIVDDDPSMVRLLARMIHAEVPGVQIFRVHGGTAALDIIHNEQPDLMLLDLLMPGLSGIDLLHQLNQNKTGNDMAVIVVTATELGEQTTQVKGELVLSHPRPLAASEWIKLLQALTSTLQPVSEPD
jgi:signal transduction histidine kinase/CheY-like chemotaxis protein